MKKIYITPEVEIIRYKIDNVMLSYSIVLDCGTEEFEAKENRNDWENIWGEM